MASAMRVGTGGGGGGGGGTEEIAGLAVESITTVGTWTSRKIVIDYPKDAANDDEEAEIIYVHGEPHDDKPPRTPIVKVEESFQDGEWCDAAQTHRSIDITLECCRDDSGIILGDSDEEVAKKEKVAKLFDMLENRQDSDSSSSAKESSNTKIKPVAVLLGIEEVDMCKYKATVCTNVLCQREMEQIREESQNVLQDKNVLLRNASRAKHVNDNKKALIVKKDDSVRTILDKALGNKCLEIKDGWWSYGFCYKQNAYQFHENTVVDTARNIIKTSIENKYTLGTYDRESSEDFPKEEEINHMYMPNTKRGADAEFSDKGNDDTNSAPGNNNKKSKDESFGGNSAYYIQEYTHGQVCEDSEVTDSTIKGGAVKEGGIERAVTVHFLCGDELDIKRIDEDSTCHYELAVAVPELCEHKYFEIPRVTTQVVKCLPVA